MKATFSNGSVTLKGDGGNNSILIGSNVIAGIDGTQINGEGFLFIPGGTITGNLTMQFTKGDNKVVVDQAVTGNLSYKGGKGKDGIHVRSDVGGNATIKTSGGLDAIRFDGLTIDGNLNVNLGGGRDKIDFNLVEVLGSTTIVTGGGNDELFVEFSDFTDVSFKAGGGNDFLAVTDTDASGLLSVNLGGGNDELYAEDISTTGSDAAVFNGGGGTDAFEEDDNDYAVSPSESSMEGSIVPDVFVRIDDLIACIDDLVL